MSSELILLRGVFRCLECGTKTTVEQGSEFLRVPVKCGTCGKRKFKLVLDESEFQELGQRNRTLQQLIELSEMWDGYLYAELIQKAMLEIESRAPLRKLSEEEVELEKAQGMRRGSS